MPWLNSDVMFTAMCNHSLQVAAGLPDSSRRRLLGVSRLWTMVMWPATCKAAGHHDSSKPGCMLDEVAGMNKHPCALSRRGKQALRTATTEDSSHHKEQDKGRRATACHMHDEGSTPPRRDWWCSGSVLGKLSDRSKC